MKLQIQKLVHGGFGLGSIDGKKIFVPYSAPGDTLEVEITNDHGGYTEAEIIEITQPAPCRIKPPCKVFGSCGGCQWQHISYSEQLLWKRCIIIETLERIGKLKNVRELVLPTIASPKEWHYRNRIQLHVDSRGRVGFYRSRSKEVVEFKECLIADELLNKKLNEMRPELAERKKGIALRLDDEELSFLQINTLQNEELKKILIEWLSGVPHNFILELYAGSGNFTFSMAAIAKKVTASDIDGRAIRNAGKLKKEKKAENIEFFCGDSERLIKSFFGPCDAIVLDPPRKGCEDGVIKAVLEKRPSSIIYISCDPATLSRDISKFIEGGYHLKSCQPVDMFPQTYHIESISFLELRKN